MAVKLRKVAAGAVSLAVLAWAAPVLAAEAGDFAPMVTAVTVTATRNEKPVDEVPATVSVIGADQIEDMLAQDIKDLIRYEPGVTVRRSPARFTAALGATGRDGDSGFNIRGLEGNRVLIQEDGIRVPDGFSFGAQAVGRGDYGDLDLMKSVEIVRGPASALYGSDGLAGAVSFITKDPADFLKGERNFAAQGKLAYSSADDSFDKGIVLAGGSERFSAMLSYTRRDGHETQSNGDNAAANTDRTEANPQDVSSNAVLGKLVFAPNASSRLRLTLEHFDTDIDTAVLSARAKPPLSATSTVDLIGRDTISRDRVSLDYRFVADAGPVRSFKTALWWQSGETEQYSAEDRNTSADRTRRNTFDNRVIGVSAEAESRFDLFGLDHRLTYGADVSQTRQTGLRDGTIPPTGETFPTRAFPNTDYTLAGVFVQDEIVLLEGRVVLYPALRFDAYDLKPKADALLTTLVPAGQSDNRLSPKVGVVFKPAPGWNVFVNYAQGFKAPAPSQVNNAFANLAFNYRSIPNPDLKPETSETFEGGVRWKNDRIALSGAVFTGTYDGFIDQVQVGGSFTPLDPALYQYVNLGKVKISGAEASGQARLGHGFTANAAVSYAHGDVYSSGTKSPLDSIEPVKVVAGLSWRQSEDRYGGALTLTHGEGKSAGRVSATACSPSCFTPPGFTIVDATAFWRVSDHATLRGGVFNITDQKYWWWSDVRGVASGSTTLDAYTPPGRNAGISLTLRY